MITQILIQVLCALLGIALVVGVLLLIFRERKPPVQNSNQINASGSTPPTPPAPTPAPVASRRSYSWLWPVVIGILALVFLVWVLPALRTPASPPQATAPKKELRQRVITRNLKFVGGDCAIERQCFVEVQKGGHAFYAIHDMPWRRDAIFRVVVCLRQRTTGNLVLLVNEGRGGQKFYMVPGSTTFGNAVFYAKEEIGRSEYFNPDGGNQIILSSQGGDTEIQFVSIVMIYWE